MCITINIFYVQIFRMQVLYNVERADNFFRIFDPENCRIAKEGCLIPERIIKKHISPTAPILLHIKSA